MNKIIILITLFLLNSTATAGILIKNIYKSSNSFITIIIDSDTSKNYIKCAVYDENNNALRMDSQFLNKRLNNVLINISNVNNIDHAECWEVDQ